MKSHWKSTLTRGRIAMFTLASGAMLPSAVLAQASPWLTGANSLVTNFQAWAVPIAVLLIMVLAFLFLSRSVSWGVAVSFMIAIVLLFGAPQIVAWVRGMFAV